MFTWQTNCIDPGLVQPGFVAETVGLHDACSFEFEPLIPEQFEAFEDSKEKESAKSPMNGRAMIGQLLSKQIKSWDIRDKDGKPVAITEVSCRRLRTMLQTKLYQIIVGIRSTDINPSWILGSESEIKSLEELEPITKQLGN
mgnify:FL=1